MNVNKTRLLLYGQGTVLNIVVTLGKGARGKGQTEEHTDRQRDRQTDRQSERNGQTDRQTEKQIGRQTEN